MGKSAVYLRVGAYERHKTSLLQQIIATWSARLAVNGSAGFTISSPIDNVMDQYELKQQYYQSRLRELHTQLWRLKQQETTAKENDDQEAVSQLREEIEATKARYQRIKKVIGAVL